MTILYIKLYIQNEQENISKVYCPRLRQAQIRQYIVGKHTQKKLSRKISGSLNLKYPAREPERTNEEWISSMETRPVRQLPNKRINPQVLQLIATQQARTSPLHEVMSRVKANDKSIASIKAMSSIYRWLHATRRNVGFSTSTGYNGEQID